MGDGTKVKGTVYQIGNGATPEVFTTIGQIIDSNVPELTQETVETTTQEDEWETCVSSGIKKGGDVGLEYNHHADDPGQLALQAAFDDGDDHNFKFTLTDGEVWTFPAIVVKLAPGKMGKGGIVKASATLRCTGEPVKS